MRIRLTFALAIALAATAVANELPYELEAHRKPSFETGGDCLIQGGRILTVTRGVVEGGDILVQNGKIAAIGKNLRAPAGIRVIDARGKVVVPGFVDGHSHRSSDGTNEGSDSITAEVRILDVLNPQSRTGWQALASGHTTGLVLHGSANAVGGQSTVIKYKYKRPVWELPVPDAPRMIKFALGENVTRSGSATASRFPRTRMGVEALYRRSFEQAREYIAEWERYDAEAKTDPKAIPPRRDLRLETLADILRGRVWVHCHSYRADEMLMMARLSKEFGFTLGALQHALEAYKIAPELAEMGVGVSMFVDNWSFKVEGYDAIPFNAAICTKAGVNVSINTDGLSGTTALNIDAAKVMRFGGLTETQALATITINPATQLGVAHRLGSLEVGKDADIGIWDGHPLSVYSKPWMTLIEGEVFFERRDAHKLDDDSFTKAVLDAPSGRSQPALPPRSRAYAITGATVHTVSGPILKGATVVVEDGRITAVGERLAIPRDAILIDARGLHVYPGFIDAGTSIGLAEIGPIGQTVDSRELGDYQPDLRALTAFQMATAHLEPARLNGITSLLTRPVGGVISGQAGIINLDGWTWEQLAMKPQGGLSVNFPSVGAFPSMQDMPPACCDAFDYHLAHGSADSHMRDVHDHDQAGDELLGGAQRRGGGGGQGGTPALRTLREYFESAAEYAEKRGQNGNSPRDLRLEAMIPYVEGQELVIFRVRNAAQIRAAVQFGKELGLNFALAGAADAWREAELLARENVPVIVTPAGRSLLSANTTVSEWDPYDTPYALPALLRRAGVRFCFQSDDNAMAMNLPFRVGQHVAYGLSREDALRALTLSAAEILGVEREVGSIEPGKLGNLVITDGDPFELTTTMQYVFVKGRPVPLESKHTRLYEQYMRRLTE
jgi:imidazolonepropionase-like amidohydrolase